MEAVILVGGLGTRLEPLTQQIPKPLLPLANKPLIVRLIERLPAEFDTVILAVGYKADSLLEYFAGAELDRKVVIVEEKEALGTGGGIGNCREHVSGTFAAFNGDVISSLDLAAMLEFHRNHGGIGTLALWEVEDPSRYGLVSLDDQQKVTSFVEKPQPEEATPPYLINAGAYLLEPEIFDYIPPARKISIEREVFPKLTDKGLHGYPFTGYWVDAGTRESFLKANRAVLEEEPSKDCAGCRIIPPVKIDPSATLKGCWVGPHVTIGPDVHLWGCELVNSVVMEGVSGAAAGARNCIIGPGAKLKGKYQNEIIVKD